MIEIDFEPLTIKLEDLDKSFFDHANSLKKIADDHSILEFDAWLLYTLAKKVPENSTIVEIGCWKGYSTCSIGLAIKDRIKK